MRGHVRKRGSSWSVVIDVGRDPATGKRRQRWHSGYKRRKDADIALTELLARLDGGSYVEPSKLTVGAFLTDRWLPAMRSQVCASTLDSYERNARRHLVPAIGHVPLQKLSADHLASMHTDLLRDGRRDGEGLSPTTVRYLHRTLSRALVDAVRRGLVPRHVASAVSPPKPERNRRAMQTWTAPQLRAFLASRRDDRLYALWLVLASTGLRRGEALALDWDAVNLDAGRLAVRRALVNVAYRLEWSEPKIEKSRRSVALDAGTVEALREHARRSYRSASRSGRDGRTTARSSVVRMAHRCTRSREQAL